MTPQDLGREIAQGAVRSTPPVAVSGAILFHGLSIPDIAQIAVCVATLGFIGLQAAYVWWKWRRDRNDSAKQRATVPPPA